MALFSSFLWLSNIPLCIYVLIFAATATAAKSLQSCPTLCDPTDGSPPGSPILGILQARTLEWVAISFSNAWKWRVKVKSLSRVQLFATPWTAAYQAPPSMGFSWQVYWSGVPFLCSASCNSHISTRPVLSFHFIVEKTEAGFAQGLIIICSRSYSKEKEQGSEAGSVRLSSVLFREHLAASIHS